MQEGRSPFKGKEPMKHIILGTAGHVDHGKTSLIRALTGIDTDRLKEEKERGITIELGFARMTLPGGLTIGIVDVPGHERFVKHMVAGAGGIDLVALVIAADEGVMPQTREHLDICSLLGIRTGLVAVTKTDLVDRDWLDLVIEEIGDFLKGTFLEPAPIVAVSAATGEGLPEFVSALEKVITPMEDRSESGFFRLPVDRVFTMKGFGTVVTGTLVSGKIRVGETADLLPQKVRAKVRGLQVHNEAVDTALAGQRTAINLQGIEKEAVERGNVLAAVDTFEPSSVMDVSFRYLPSAGRKLKTRAAVRFHCGTSEIPARIVIMDRPQIEPGEECCGQIFLEAPAVASGGDRFVLRSISPAATIGGGVILDPLAKKWRAREKKRQSEWEILQGGTGPEKTSVILHRAGLEGISRERLAVRTGLSQGEVKRILDQLLSRREALLLDGDPPRLFHRDVYRKLQEDILAEATEYHRNQPLRKGCSREELRIRIGASVDVKLFNRALRDLEEGKKIVSEQDTVRIPSHAVELTGDLESLRGEIENTYREAGLEPPLTREVLERSGDRKGGGAKILDLLTREGTLVKVSEELYFHREALEGLAKTYTDFLLREGKATPGTFRDLTNLSRKFTIPLMEYFDKTRLTMRVGDHRVLRERREEGNG